LAKLKNLTEISTEARERDSNPPRSSSRELRGPLRASTTSLVRPIWSWLVSPTSESDYALQRRGNDIGHWLLFSPALNGLTAVPETRWVPGVSLFYGVSLLYGI